MAQRPRGTEGMTGDGFSAEAPADAAQMQDVAGGPGNVPSPAPMTQPAGGGPARVMQTDQGTVTFSGTAIASEAAGEPNLSTARLGGILAGNTPPAPLKIDADAGDVSDEDLEPEYFRCSRLNMTIPITQGCDRYPNGDRMQVPLAFDELVVKDGICRTPSVAELTPKYLSYWQATGIVGAELQRKMRGSVVAVILKAKDMCKNTTSYCISAGFTPLPKAVDPNEMLRQQVNTAAAAAGVTPEEFIKGLGQANPAAPAAGPQHRIVRDMSPEQMHRHIVEAQARGGVAAQVRQPESPNAFPQPAGV